MDVGRSGKLSVWIFIEFEYFLGKNLDFRDS